MCVILLIYFDHNYNITTSLMRKLLIIIITTFTLVTSVNASSDGELVLKKNPPEVKLF